MNIITYCYLYLCNIGRPNLEVTFKPNSTIFKFISRYSHDLKISRIDVITRAIYLLKAAYKESKHGHSIAIVKSISGNPLRTGDTVEVVTVINGINPHVNSIQTKEGDI